MLASTCRAAGTRWVRRGIGARQLASGAAASYAQAASASSAPSLAPAQADHHHHPYYHSNGSNNNSNSSSNHNSNHLGLHYMQPPPVLQFGSSASSPRRRQTSEGTPRYLNVRNVLAEHAQRPLARQNLAELVERGRRAQADPEELVAMARALHDDLLVRLAKQYKMLTHLPYGLSESPSIVAAAQLYFDSWKDVVAAGVPATGEDNERLADVLASVLDRHSNMVVGVARAVLELRRAMGSSALDGCPYLRKFLDEFYLARIGVRFVIMNHLALGRPHAGHVGAVAERCDPADAIEVAVANATAKCLEQYGVAPDVDTSGVPSVEFPYVADHIHHIMFEMLKNSMRAVVERHGQSGLRSELPPVRVSLAEDSDSVLIKIEDLGGGVRLNDLDVVWAYLFTTATATDDMFANTTGGLRGAPMSGLGYGLPLTRLFARYFGGDVEFVALDGHGADVTVTLRKLDSPDIILT